MTRDKTASDSLVAVQLSSVQQELALVKEALLQLQEVVEGLAPRRPGRPERPSLEKIDAVFEAVRVLNPTLPPNKRWAFTQSLLNISFGVNVQAAKRYIAEHQAEIEQMHRENGINPENGTQNRGNDLEQLRQLLADYEQLTFKLTIVDAEALLEAADLGLKVLRKKGQAVTVERAERAISVLEEAIGYEEEE